MYKIVLVISIIISFTFAYTAPVIGSCPSSACSTSQQTIGQPILGCSTRMKQLVVEDSLTINGTACFNGTLIACSGLKVCTCWNGLLCTGLSSVNNIPMSCTLDDGDLLFNATTPGAITLVLISQTTKDYTSASCKLASIQPGDTIRLTDTDNGDTFADLEVISRVASGSFYGLELTNGTGVGTFASNSCLCLENFGQTIHNTELGLGNYIFLYKTTAQNAGITWSNVTFNVVGASDNTWDFGGGSQLTCPRDGVYDIEYTLQYALNQSSNNAEVVSTKLLENGSDIPGSQAAISPEVNGDIGAGRPRRCLTRKIIRSLLANTVLTLQHISIGGVNTVGRIQPGGVSAPSQVAGTLTIIRID